MSPRVLLTGATGTIGGFLLPRLEAEGYSVRCLTRRPEALAGRTASGTEVVAGDVLEPRSLRPALDGVDAALYLIHSMAGPDYAERDRRAAHTFAEAARRAGVRRVVYLGGLGSGPELSEHLTSRHEVGRVLREHVPTVELRASVVIGPGSLSFEMVRALVERLPLMVTPRWVRTPTQPIALDDALAYMTLALDPEIPDRVYEIGGADRVTYAELMRAYARRRRLRRLMIPVPVLSPRLSGLWLGLVTPVYARVGRELVEGLRNPTVVRDRSALEVFPVRPLGVEAAIDRALAREDEAFARARWSGSPPGAGRLHPGEGPGRRIVDVRQESVPAPPRAAFAPIRRIGGATGWYFATWMWRLRGLLDRGVGGPGMRSGRRDPEELLAEDRLDFWRVEAVEPDRRLRLRAEMRLPGRAWLQFEVEPTGDGSTIRQVAEFDPRGLGGLLYWYALYPLHALIFRGMLRKIARLARGRGQAGAGGGPGLAGE